MQLTEAQIKHMAEQFLRWKLPDDLDPDGGISFDKKYLNQHGPVGTNILNYNQAEAMVKFMFEGLPASKPQSDFKPCVAINEELRLTEAIFEDVAHISVPVFEGVYHYMDKYLAVDDYRLVGFAVWQTKPAK